MGLVLKVHTVYEHAVQKCIHVGASDGVCSASGLLLLQNGRSCSDDPRREMTAETTKFRWRSTHDTICLIATHSDLGARQGLARFAGSKAGFTLQSNPAQIRFVLKSDLLARLFTLHLQVTQI